MNTAFFWTKTRLATTALTFALLVGAVSSCNQTEEVRPDGKSAGANANQASAPIVTVQREDGPPTAAPAAAAAAAGGDILPDSVRQEEIMTLDGKSFRLADYDGKVVVLNLWATWCGPCRMEIPDLIELSKEYGSKGVEVVGLTTEDPESDEELVREFARDFKINYRLGWAEHEFARQVSRGRGAIPQVFVIGRDGRLVRHLVGFDPRRSPTLLREAVEQAAGGA